MKSSEMKISNYSKELLKSTNCHRVLLKKDSEIYSGIYNGLSNWGRVENTAGRIVQTMSLDPEEDGYQSAFFPSSFKHWGYELIEGQATNKTSTALSYEGIFTFQGK